MKKSFLFYLLCSCGILAAADNAFLPVPNGSLYVAPDTALDLSGQVAQIPAGSKGRLIVNSKGEFAFAAEPQNPVRFMSCSFAHHEELAFNTYSKQELDEFADAIVRQGYNMIRFHYLDDMISGTKRGLFLKDWENTKLDLPQTAEEVQFKADIMDRFLYFIDACGKRGIYLNLDLMSSFAGYNNGTVPLWKANRDTTVKMQFFTNEKVRNNWIAGVRKLLETVNPYNGKKLKDDPAVCLVHCLNEQDILLQERDYSNVLHERWVTFLKEKYKTVEKLRKAWNDPAISDFETVRKISREAEKNTPAGRDMVEFCGGLEKEISDFYLNFLNKNAPELLSANWNMRPRFMEVPARAKHPVIMHNYYHAHPHYGSKTTVPQYSSLFHGGTVMKQFSVMRLLDRPFVSTEYGFTFWNRYRHEQGLLHGACAALQQWGGITAFSSSVVYGSRRIECFCVGADPIGRASQVVEFFAFRRGDVSPARNTVAFKVDDELIHEKGLHGIGDSLSRLWAVCRVGLLYGKPAVPVKTALRIRPAATASVGGDGNYSTTSLDKSSESAEEVLEVLRKKRLLPPGNRTDAAKGIFQSDTNELLVDMKNYEAFVTAPRLEGAVLKSSKPVALGALKIHSISTPASVTMISLNSRAALADSGSLLLVIATDARNSEMKLSGEDDCDMSDYGKLPVLVKSGVFNLSLKRRANGEKFRLYALDLTGKRIAELPVENRGKELNISINTAEISGGPALFFELVKE